MTPHDYQTTAVQQSREAFIEGFTRLMLCMPTGAGKTFTACLMASLAVNLGKRVAWISHRTELLSQAGGEFEEFGLVAFNVVAGVKSVPQDANLYNCSVKMFQKHAAQRAFGELDLIILDEGHRGEYKTLLSSSAIPNHVRVIGLSATPQSAKKKDPLANYYDALIMPTTQRHLIDTGRLSRCTTYVTDFDVKEAGLVKNSKGYTPASEEKYFTRKRNINNIIEMWEAKDHLRESQTLLFAPTVATAEAYAAKFRDKGYSVGVMHGKLSDDQRHDLMTAYIAGEIQVMCNVQIMTAGTNIKTIECIIWLSRTGLISTYVQGTGRGSRVCGYRYWYPNKQLQVVNEPKTHFYVLDAGAACIELAKNTKNQHCTWDAPIDWKTCFYGQKSYDEGLLPTKTCKACDAIIFAGASVCEFCGTPCPVRPALEVFAQLVTIEGEVTAPEREQLTDMQTGILELKQQQQEKEYKKGWWWRKVYAKYGKEGLKLIAKTHNYKDNWLQNTLRRWGM